MRQRRTQGSSVRLARGGQGSRGGLEARHTACPVASLSVNPHAFGRSQRLAPTSIRLIVCCPTPLAFASSLRASPTRRLASRTRRDGGTTAVSSASGIQARWILAATSRYASGLLHFMAVRS